MSVDLRLFRHKGVVYMLHRATQYVYCYNPEEPIRVGVWDREDHSVRFMDGALEALRSGDLDNLKALHGIEKSSHTE